MTVVVNALPDRILAALNLTDERLDRMTEQEAREVFSSAVILAYMQGREDERANHNRNSTAAARTPDKSARAAAEGAKRNP